ncbi:MAG: TetR/AcrR family transcriptional regulator [Pseudomonadota bacterium]
MTAPAKIKKDIASQRIVDVALELFATHGYGSVSTTKIAKAANISQPSIHYHYSNKDALWKAAVVELKRRVDAATEAIMEDIPVVDGDAYSELRASCLVLHKMHIDVPELGKIIFLEGQAGGDRLDWLMQEVFADSYDSMISNIKECTKLGKIKPHRPHQILMILHGAAVTYYNLAPMVQSTFDRDALEEKNWRDFADAYMDIVFKGLEA